MDVGVELLWWLRSRRVAAGDLSWPLDPELRRDCVVHWPTRYQWAPGRKWLEPLRRGLRALVPVRRAEIAQPYPGIALFRVRAGGRETTVAVDYADHSGLTQRCVDEVSAYFKMQFSETGYSQPHVYPGGYVPGDCILYGGLPSLRATRDLEVPRFDVYGRFGLGFAGEVRGRALDLLRTQQVFHYEGGASKRRYSRYLREIASARICVDLPGNGDFCFRLIDYLAIGSCIVAVRPRNLLPVPLTDREHIAYVADDLSDLVEVCEFYLENPAERERLRENSRRYFDRYLHRNQLAAYYLSRCLPVQS